MDPVLISHVREPNGHTLESYVRRGGYQALRKTIGMAPAQVIDAVKASGLRGRGGAGFPTGMKWQFVPKDSPKPKYLCCNADESEPGTFKDHVLMERNPHLLFEGCLIGCYAIGAKAAYIYIRGEFYHVQRILEDEIEAARAQGYIGKNIFGSGLRLRDLRPPRRRRLRGGRGERAARVARGQAGAAAPAAAVPRGRRAVRLPDGDQQRRDALQRPAHHHQRAGVVRRPRPREERWAEAVLHQRPRREAGRLRDVDERDAARADLRVRGRDPRRPPAQGHHPGWFVDAGDPSRSTGRAGEFRRPREGRLDARVGGHHRDGRHDVHGVARGEPAALLQARVVRKVHAVPRGHRLAAEDPAPHRDGRGGDDATSTCC